jgi:hypothetical protein
MYVSKIDLLDIDKVKNTFHAMFLFGSNLSTFLLFFLIIMSIIFK